MVTERLLCRISRPGLVVVVDPVGRLRQGRCLLLRSLLPRLPGDPPTAGSTRPRSARRRLSRHRPPHPPGRRRPPAASGSAPSLRTPYRAFRSLFHSGRLSAGRRRRVRFFPGGTCERRGRNHGHKHDRRQHQGNKPGSQAFPMLFLPFHLQKTLLIYGSYACTGTVRVIINHIIIAYCYKNVNF